MQVDKLNIGICGLGLIGGSIAKALRRSGVKSITAYNKSRYALDSALSEGVIDCGSTEDYRVFKECDVVFVCTPIDYVVNKAILISEVSGALITDAASTKAEIHDVMPKGIRFIGGHPMAGSEQSGYRASSETLFENAVYIITRREDTNEEDYNLLRSLVLSINAIPVDMDALEHDRAVGIISHLPHLVAAALVNTARTNDYNNMLTKLAAGGFKDITRIASSDAGLWEQIIMSSKDTIIDILQGFSQSVNGLIDILSRRDSEALIDYLDKARSYRNSVEQGRRGLIASSKELYIEVSDEPGIIGAIATILGDNRINIKNLYIENNREYEGGSLRITLGNSEDIDSAVKLLEEHNYKARAN